MAKPGPTSVGIYCLDVGQGDCTVVVPPRAESGAIVFDVADQYVLERFVANHKLRVTDVIASHLDIDHIRGMLGFLKGPAAADVEHVYIDLDRKTTSGEKETLDKLLDYVEGESEKVPPLFIQRQSWRNNDGPLLVRRGTGWKVEIVLPFMDKRTKELRKAKPYANLMSAVLRVEHAEAAVLVGADAPLGSWQELNKRNRKLIPAKAIRAPHHGGKAKHGGSAWKTYENLYDGVGATVGVISVGTNNRWSHPNEEHVFTLRRGGQCRVLCTQLTPRCHDEPSTVFDRLSRVSQAVAPNYRHQPRAGRARPNEVPCAGSIVVWLDRNGKLHHEPGRSSAHARELLQQHIDEPLCLRAFADVDE